MDLAYSPRRPLTPSLVALRPLEPKLLTKNQGPIRIEGAWPLYTMNLIYRLAWSLPPSLVALGPLDPKLLTNSQAPIRIEGAWPLYHRLDPPHITPTKFHGSRTESLLLPAWSREATCPQVFSINIPLVAMVTPNSRYSYLAVMAISMSVAWSASNGSSAKSIHRRD